MLLALGVAAALCASGVAHAQFDPRLDGPAVPGAADDYAVVRLADAPLASYGGGVPGLAATRPPPGLRLSLGAPPALAYRAYLARARAGFEAYLRAAAPRAQVVRSFEVVFHGVAVKLNGEPLDALAAGPHVLAARRSGLVYPALNASADHLLAPALWGRIETAGLGRPGAGVKIGIIDTGIDQRHVFFDQSAAELGSPGPDFPRGDARFTSPKVIVARAYFSGPPGARTPAAVQPHGTHVAGTVAGRPYRRPIDGGFVAPGQVSGVAPYAFLGNYNVFPGTAEYAYTHDVMQAIEDAVVDGMDVLNISLGGRPRDGADLLDAAVDAAVDAGVVVAVAAGNEGSARGTLAAPGTAERAITAGASNNPHFFGLPVAVTGPGPVPLDLQGLAAAVGDGPPVPAPQVEAPYVDWDRIDGAAPGLACDSVPGAPAAGKIALIKRGACFFSTKVNNAAAAGAIAVIVRADGDDDPVAMTMADPTAIPAVMVDGVAGRKLADWVARNPSATVRLVAGTSELLTPQRGDPVAAFSSRGPTPGRERIKPDVTAPGVNVYSSVSGPTHDRFGAFHGTSVASAHVAGAAALLRQLHPGWSPDQIKSALVNTAVSTVTEVGAAAGALARGAGRIDLSRAAAASATFAPVSVGLGRLDPAAGVRSEAVDVTNHGVAGVFRFEVVQARAVPGGAVVIEPAVHVDSGRSARVILSVQLPAIAPAGDYEGHVQVTGADGSTYRIPYWFRVGAP